MTSLGHSRRLFLHSSLAAAVTTPLITGSLPAQAQETGGALMVALAVSPGGGALAQTPAGTKSLDPSRVDGFIDDETAYRLGVLLDALS